MKKIEIKLGEVMRSPNFIRHSTLNYKGHQITEIASARIGPELYAVIYWRELVTRIPLSLWDYTKLSVVSFNKFA